MDSESVVTFFGVLITAVSGNGLFVYEGSDLNNTFR